MYADMASQVFKEMEELEIHTEKSTQEVLARYDASTFSASKSSEGIGVLWDFPDGSHISGFYGHDGKVWHHLGDSSSDELF